MSRYSSKSNEMASFVTQKVVLYPKIETKAKFCFRKRSEFTPKSKDEPNFYAKCHGIPQNPMKSHILLHKRSYYAPKFKVLKKVIL